MRMSRYLQKAVACVLVGLWVGPVQAQDIERHELAMAPQGEQSSLMNEQTLSTLPLTEEVQLVDGQNVFSPFMTVYSVSLPPIGYVRFCERNPHECVSQVAADERVELTQERWQELESVNRFVNQEIYPVTDEDLYGRVEFWTYPSTKGDCEDYVLLKRRMLMERGWPASALLITVVLDEEGAGHAILTARTSGGDFILDNKLTEVLAWAETPYRYLKRQDARNKQLWVSLYPTEQPTPVAAFSSESLQTQ